MKKLTRNEVVEKFGVAYGIDPKAYENIRVKVVSHENNPMAPEKYCYKLTFTLWGQKKRFAFWPETVGYQGY